MITHDMIKFYPNLAREYAIRVVELQDHILSTYDRKISSYTADQFRRAGEKSWIVLVISTWQGRAGDVYRAGHEG